jgi:hypothetical protein
VHKRVVGADFVIPNSLWELGMVHSFMPESAELEKGAQVLALIFSCRFAFLLLVLSLSLSIQTVGSRTIAGSSNLLLLLHLLFSVISLAHIGT